MKIRCAVTSAVLGFAITSALAAESAPPSTRSLEAPSTAAPSRGAAPTTRKSCQSLDLKAPAGSKKKDGAYDLGKLDTPRGELLYRGSVAKGQVTDAWPVFKGKRLKEKSGSTPKAVIACAKEHGDRVASSMLRQMLDIVVPDAEARWCSSPKSYTQCTGDFLCTTCVFSGRKKCGCYSF